MRRPLSASKLARIRQLLLDAYWIADTPVLESFAMIALDLATDAQRAKPPTAVVMNRGDFVMQMDETVAAGDRVGISPDGAARLQRRGDICIGIAADRLNYGDEIIFSTGHPPGFVPLITRRT